MNADTKLPKWKVYFNGSFYGKCPGNADRTHAGTELPVNRTFLWDKEEWLIPSVYSCSKGLVIDFLQKIPAGRIRDFIEIWRLGPDSDHEDFNSEQQLLIENDNPLTCHLLTKVQLNGTILPFSHSTGICWNPVFSEFDTLEAQMALKHYHLDPAFGWTVWRSFFLWKTRRKPLIKTLSVHLSTERQSVIGPHFHTKAPGDTTVFTCPSTGTKHTLAIQEYTVQRIDTARFHFHDPMNEYPDCFTVIGYTITPALPKESFTLIDCAKGDNPRKIQPGPQSPTSAGPAEIAVIGGADCPTAIFFSDPDQPDMRYASSSPHFEPVMDVEWRMIFYEQRKTDLCVNII